MKETKLHLFDTGYCLNLEKMVARSKPLKVKRFYALVGLIEHPQLGPILFDTGYSSHVVQLYRSFPYLIYSLITPIRFENDLSAAQQIKKLGYQATDIKHIILSHFHPDHVGGLKDFKQAQFHCSKKAYLQLKELSFFRSMKEVFFDDLFPLDFGERVHEIETKPCPLPFKTFSEGFDIFGDQSIIAVSLPGHARGQMGILLKTGSQMIFLAADACWQTDNYRNLDYPHLLAKSAIYNYPDFLSTLYKLQELKKNHPEIEIIPSHCQEMWTRYVKEGKTC